MNLCVITLVMLSWCCGRLTAKPIQTGNQTDSAVAEEIKRARDALLWLQFFEYAEKNDTVEDCLSCEIEECDGDCLVKLNNILSQPLRDMKEFYRIHPLDGNLTEEVLKKMSEYRCKEKDIPEADDITNAKVTDDKAEDHVRVKRYSRLANQRWDLQRTPVLTISFLDYLQKFTPAQQEQIAAECATLWAKPSGLAFQIKPYSGATNIGISHTYIDGPYNSLGSGMSPTPYSNGYSFLKLDRAEPWKLRNSSPGQGVSLKWAMCHEMGHNLDFGHSQDRSSICTPRLATVWSSCLLVMSRGS
ncbi:MMP7 [Bugula neritina]|uniref:MMP7 n=1 Tax=Bugula neritina TaxID=10212 RepID=A0A7J7IR52_BUGNE|nr:MMP7 [Bugula neritina]